MDEVHEVVTRLGRCNVRSEILWKRRGWVRGTINGIIADASGGFVLQFNEDCISKGKS